ncbi:hypothetical protein [Synechococcus phage S-B68]|nr:hypothetical protein [Synechococcus phage S-B68]
MWSLALGEKTGKSNGEADTIAVIRTLLTLNLLVTNCFIIANAIRHWNNVPSPTCNTQQPSTTSNQAK